MDLQLNNQHALITGGSKGIGLACALLFLQEGARVSLVARNAATLQAAAASLEMSLPGSSARIAVHAADLKDPQAARAALEAMETALGPLDILVNSAGAALRTPPDELTPQSWHDAMDAKYFTYIHMMDPAVKGMAARGRRFAVC